MHGCSQVQAAAAGAMGALGLAAGAIGFYGVAPAQLLTVTSAFSVFMVCSAAGGRMTPWAPVRQSGPAIDSSSTPSQTIINAYDYALSC